MHTKSDEGPINESLLLYPYRPCEEKEQCDFQSPYQKKAQGSSHPFDDGAHQQGAKGRTSQEYEGIESHNAAQKFLGRCHLNHCIAVHNEGDDEKPRSPKESGPG